MPRFLILLVTIWCSVAGQASDKEVIRLKSFALRDQFGGAHNLQFPGTNFMVITVADRSGSDLVGEWVAPLKKKYGKTVAIHGIADVSAVPGFLRSMIREKFAKAQSHPVMLDWDGAVISQFKPAKNVPNVYVVAPSGEVRFRVHGQPHDDDLKKLFEAVDQLAPK